MNDEIKTLYKYAGDSIHCINRGDKEFLEKIVDNIHSLEPFDHPDMVIRLGEKVLAIEHFEFDASSFNRKGSMDKRELAKRNREFNELINNLDVTKEPIVITTSVKCIYSLDYYIKNFKQVFKKHLIKAAEYKSCLINNGMVKQANDITICFFIVDTTPLGCYYLKDGNLNSLVPFQVLECLDLITESKEIDCFLFGFFDGKKYSLEFIRNRVETIELVKKIGIIDFQEYDFFCFEPQETRFCSKIL